MWLSSKPSHLSISHSVPHMVYYRDRVSSFESWPVQLRQDKHTLASAGFCYTNKGDLVKCSLAAYASENGFKKTMFGKNIEDGLHDATILTLLGF